MDLKLEGFAKKFDRVTLEYRPATPERPKPWRVRLEDARDGSGEIEGWGSTPITAVYDAGYKLSRSR
jgi:hypothetical protein